jgi:hypothetical protein
MMQQLNNLLRKLFLIVVFMLTVTIIVIALCTAVSKANKYDAQMKECNSLIKNQQGYKCEISFKVKLV